MLPCAVAIAVSKVGLGLGVGVSAGVGVSVMVGDGLGLAVCVALGSTVKLAVGLGSGVSVGGLEVAVGGGTVGLGDAAGWAQVETAIVKRSRLGMRQIRPSMIDSYSWHGKLFNAPVQLYCRTAYIGNSVGISKTSRHHLEGTRRLDCLYHIGNSHAFVERRLLRFARQDNTVNYGPTTPRSPSRMRTMASVSSEQYSHSARRIEATRSGSPSSARRRKASMACSPFPTSNAA